MGFEDEAVRAVRGEEAMSDRVTMEQVEFEKVYLYCQSRITEIMTDYPGLSQNAKFDMIRYEAEQLILTMKTWCATGRIPDYAETEIVEWPDGVWQAFKEKFMPKWFVRRYPVRHASKTIVTERNFYFVCPHIRVPDDRTHIKFMLTGTKQAERI